MKKFLFIIAFIVTLAVGFGLGVLVTGGSLSDSIWTSQRPPDDRPTTAGLTLTPGVFTGTSYDGFYGRISVDVTVNDDGVITDVEVVYHNETTGFYGPAFAHLIPAVVNAQSAELDVYTGATRSSTGFINAVRDALFQSAGEAPLASDTVSPVEIAGDTFTGVGEGGYRGDITVAVTIDAGRIVHIVVTDMEETPRFADPALEYLIPAVIEAQSHDVDIFTGSTYTSRAFIAAVEDALRQAGLISS